MKRVISFVLAVALVACFCIVPVTAAEDVPTAKFTAKLSGDTVPQAGERFIVTVALEDISSNLFTSAQVFFNWPREVASLVNFKTTDVTPLDATRARLALGNIADLYSESDMTGKFSTTFEYLQGETGIIPGYSYYTHSIANSSLDKTPAAAVDGYYKLFDIAFVLNEGYTYDDFYFVIDKEEAKAVLANAYPPEGEENSGKPFTYPVSRGSDGNITVEDIAAKEEVKYESVDGQPGYGNADSGIYPLPKVITHQGTVKFTLTTVAPGDAMIGINKGSTMTGNGREGAYFTNSTVQLLVGGQKVSVRPAAGKQEIGDMPNNSTYNVEIVINNDAGTWSVTITDAEGASVASAENVGIRTAADVLDSIVLVDNGYTGRGALTVTNLEVITDDEQPTEPSEPETQAPSEDESGTEAPSEDETTPSEPETQAPSEDESGTEAPSEDETTPSEPATIPENAIVASNTDSINVTKGTIGYSDVAERRDDFKGTDALFSASWGDVRYGEIRFIGIEVPEGQAITKAQLTLTPGEIMAGRSNTFDIYAVAPESFGQPTAIDGTVVGSGAFEAVDVPVTVELDLTKYFATYPEAEEVVLAWMVTDGLIGVYGATFDEKAPYIVVEVGEAPTEPESQPGTEPESTPSEPESTPSEPESTPSEPESQPGTEPEEPTKPADAVDSVAGQNEAAIKPLDQIITADAPGTVTFTFVANDTASNTLIAITNKEAMLKHNTDGDRNYFANAGVQLGITNNGTTLRYRSGDAADWATDTFTIVPGVEYTIDVTLDVANQKWSAVVKLAGEVASFEAEEPIFTISDQKLRFETPVDSIDSIVMLDNDNKEDTGYYFDVQVDGGLEPTPELLPLVGEATTQGNAIQGTFTINDEYVGEDTPAEGDQLVYVISYLVDNKAKSAVAVPVDFKDGKVEVAGQFGLDDGSVGEETYQISVLKDVVSPLEALIEGNMGTPVGSIK